MKLKNPGGDLVWLSPTLAFFGFFLAYVEVRNGSPGMAALFGSLGLFSLLVWFDLKWVAIPLMIYFSLAIIAGIMMLFIKGFSWLLLCKLVIAAYTIHGFWEWRRRE